MSSSDPGEDLVPCMRSVQLSDGDKQLMSAFKNKVDGDTDTYLHSESDPRYKGAHIPSRTFRILQAATGGDDGVSGGAPPSSSRIGGPGQNRTVVVTMPTGGASGPAVPASQREEPPEPRKYTGGNIPSRSFRVLQQMTADDQGSAPIMPRPAEGQPRRSPSHYAHGPESVTAATHAPLPSPPTLSISGVPTCERIEQERLRQLHQRRKSTDGRYFGGRNPSRSFQLLAGEYNDEVNDLENGRRGSMQKDVVLGELRAVGAGRAPRPARPSAVPSRSFRLLQQEYGSDDQDQELDQEKEQDRGRVSSGPQEPVIIRTTPEQQKQRMAATSKTYRLLHADPSAVPSVLGRNGR